MSDDGWMWLLAWMQVGVKTVYYSTNTELGRKQIRVMQSQPPFRERIKLNSEIQHGDDKITIFCLHLSGLPQLEHYLDTLATSKAQIRIVSVAPLGALQKEVRTRLGSTYRWVTLRHSAIGGLTGARIMIGIVGLSGGSFYAQRRYPIRPLGRFLEPAVRLAQWRHAKPGCTDCWYPHEADAKPFPWPLTNAPEWVETPTVFFDFRIQRLLTIKERCQILDVRQEWAQLLEHIWTWNDGSTPPLRFYVEFITDMLPDLRNDSGNKEGEEVEEQMEIVSSKINWGRNRAPWLGRGSISTHEQIERIQYFGWIWDASDYEEISVACKGDDAGVNLSLWAVGGEGPLQDRLRTFLRKHAWRFWIKRLHREALLWLRDNPGKENEEAVFDCLYRCSESDWWNWNQGSRLLFWRWPKNWFLEARDGAPGFHTKQPRPNLHFPPVPIQEDWIIEKDREKLEKLIKRGYIVPGFCRVAVPRFPVPKGSDDIRVVWDLAKNGVNETMYTPSFFLATMATYIRRIEVGSYGGDFDIGEQFHNYMLHPSEQPNCGVELPADLRESLSKQGIMVERFMRWGRLVFGWQSSPYLALRMLARAVELAKGDPSDNSNPFGWNSVQLNLPGTTNYDPRYSRVRKLNAQGQDAADLVTFYDDGRVFAPTEELAHSALRQITSRLQYYGNQDAARKRRRISQRPGAWAGGIAYTDQETLRVFVSPQKWEKAREFLEWIWIQLQQPTIAIERKRFQSGKGFLVYMSTCYEFIQPYLKGFHLSEDAWRRGRDDEGWKAKQSVDFQDDDVETELPYEPYDEPTSIQTHNHENAPPMIKPVPRLREDVRILKIFFKGATPVQVLPRPVTGSSFVAYGGGDASGEGFGGQVLPNGMQPLLRRGFWCPTAADESSNWRELRNVIDTIRIEAVSGRLVGREVWFASDNTTAVNAYYRGTSTSKKLHDMTTELRLLTIEGNFTLRLYHIAGTRMIASGIDGLSRGELDIDSLTKTIQILLPLHNSPLERMPILRQWLSTWLDPHYKVATPSDWFYTAQQGGDYDLPTKTTTWIWDLAPAAALHALEELGTARLKRHDVIRGVILIPNLLNHEWTRRFNKIVDVYFTIPPGSIPEWPREMHESLTIGLYFPLFRYEPWDWKRVPFMVPFGNAMSAMHKTDSMEARDLLCKFWRACTGVTTMPQRLVSELLQSTSWRKFLSIPNKR